jgi:aerobic-type carbon monoxide dehydrogenase small subunit (CoxS/CutS family)
LTSSEPMPQAGNMAETITLEVNGRVYHLQVDPETPLLYVLRNDLGLTAAKVGCGLEQCGACKVIADGQGKGHLAPAGALG